MSHTPLRVKERLSIFLSKLEEPENKLIVEYLELLVTSVRQREKRRRIV